MIITNDIHLNLNSIWKRNEMHFFQLFVSNFGERAIFASNHGIWFFLTTFLFCWTNVVFNSITTNFTIGDFSEFFFLVAIRCVPDNYFEFCQTNREQKKTNDSVRSHRKILRSICNRFFLYNSLTFTESKSWMSERENRCASVRIMSGIHFILFPFFYLNIYSSSLQSVYVSDFHKIIIFT